MAAAEKRTVSLPLAQARYMDELVATGGYASVSEVVRAGLRALRERDAAVEHWLREEVAPIYDAMQADPERALAPEQVSAELQVHHAARSKASQRDA